MKNINCTFRNFTDMECPNCNGTLIKADYLTATKHVKEVGRNRKSFLFMGGGRREVTSYSGICHINGGICVKCARVKNKQVLKRNIITAIILVMIAIIFSCIAVLIDANSGSSGGIILLMLLLCFSVLILGLFAISTFVIFIKCLFYGILLKNDAKLTSKQKSLLFIHLLPSDDSVSVFPITKYNYLQKNS